MQQAVSTLTGIDAVPVVVVECVVTTIYTCKLPQAPPPPRLPNMS